MLKINLESKPIKLRKKILSVSFLLVLITVLFSVPAFSATGDGLFTDPNIKYIGRWDTPIGSTYSNSYWGGTYLRINFTGTTVKIQLADKTSIAAQIDNGNFTRYDNVSGTVDLTPNPLTNGTHTLILVAKSDNDELKFQGLILDPGCTTQAVPSKKIIEFIGDSITAGHAAGPNNTDESISDYAWLTGETLGCDHTQIAYSGITLSTGYHYAGHPSTGMEDAYFKQKSIIYAHATETDYSPDWDFNKYTADAVVINLGTNDCWAGPVPSSTFESNYTNFLANIRAKYPNAQIFVMRTLVGYYATETLNAVNTRINAGDAKLHYIDTTNWLTSSDCSDYVHPNQIGHQKITEKLVSILQPYLNDAGSLEVVKGVENASQATNTATTVATDTTATNAKTRITVKVTSLWGDISIAGVKFSPKWGSDLMASLAADIKVASFPGYTLESVTSDANSVTAKLTTTDQLSSVPVGFTKGLDWSSGYADVSVEAIS